MAGKILTAAQRQRAIKDISESVERNLHWEITDLERGYDDAWLNTLQDSILSMIASAVVPHVKSAIENWEGQIERTENEKLKKVEAENKQLKKDLKKYAAIQKVIEDAENGD